MTRDEPHTTLRADCDEWHKRLRDRKRNTLIATIALEALLDTCAHYERKAAVTWAEFLLELIRGGSRPDPHKAIERWLSSKEES